MLKVEHIVKCYGAYHAVDDISFEVKRRQVLGFLGRNGAGKSTAMNIITGYIAPTSGRILWNGEDTRKIEEIYKAGIGYLPEVPPLYPDLTVYEMLEYICGLKRIRNTMRVRHIREVMVLARIEDCGHMLIKKLSKGYRQRVGLAAALIGNPDLLVLDEPTAGLDPEQVAWMRDLVYELGRDRAIILSSHVLSEIESMCNTLLIIKKGRVVASGKVNEIAKEAKCGMHRLRVRTAGEAVYDALETIPGLLEIRKITSRESGYDEYLLKGKEDLCESVMEAIRRVEAPLRMLYPMDVELEDVFLRLTQDEEENNA